jgi:hypothetical protein
MKRKKMVDDLVREIYKSKDMEYNKEDVGNIKNL